MADRILGVSLSHLVEPLRLFHPTRVDSVVNGGGEIFIVFFVPLYPTQSKIVGWNKRSGSTMTLQAPCKSGLSRK